MRLFLPLCGALVLGSCAPAAAPLVMVALEPDAALDPAVAKLLGEQLAAVRERPSDPRVHGTLGLALEANEQWSPAEQSFANAAVLQPEEPHWNLHRAIALGVLGRNAEANELLLAVERELSAAPYVQQRLGEAALARGEHARALAYFERTAALAPARAEGHAGAGAAELALGHPDRAERHLLRAIEIDPGYRRAHYQLGLAYRELGRAEADRELALGLSGNVRMIPDPFTDELVRFTVSASARLQRALALIEAGKPERAARTLEALRLEDPGNVTVLNDLAIALQHTGALDRALHWLEEAARLEPEVPSTWINLASLALDQNTSARALECARRAVELAPQSAKAHVMLARVLLRQECLREACAELELGIRLDPRECDALALLADTWLALGEHESARACYRSLGEQRPFDPRAPVGLAMLALERGEREAAELELAAARALAPDHPEVIALARELATPR